MNQVSLLRKSLTLTFLIGTSSTMFGFLGAVCSSSKAGGLFSSQLLSTGSSLWVAFKDSHIPKVVTVRFWENSKGFPSFRCLFFFAGWEDTAWFCCNPGSKRWGTCTWSWESTSENSWYSSPISSDNVRFILNTPYESTPTFHKKCGNATLSDEYELDIVLPGNEGLNELIDGDWQCPPQGPISGGLYQSPGFVGS